VVQPTGHAVQFTTFDTVEYVFTSHATHDTAPEPTRPVTKPAKHGSHKPDDDADTYEPAAHATHPEAPVWPSVVLPASHATQLVTDVAPAVVYVFTPHATHDVAPTELLPVSEPAPHTSHRPLDEFTNEFNAHATHADWPLCPSVVSPAAHARQLVLDVIPASEYSFTPHATHDVAPPATWPVIEPAPHVSHAPVEEFTNEFTPHSTHADWPTWPTVVQPDGHAKHASDTFDITEYVFTPHATHDTAPEPSRPVV
jgi:hypothetical protein